MSADIKNRSESSAVEMDHFNLWIKNAHILNDISLTIEKNKINTIIGPSGSGKSTLIRSINRINDGVEGLKREGSIWFNSMDIAEKNMDVTSLRKEIGMVFQKPCIFPTSIRKNVLFGVKHHRSVSGSNADKMVEYNLKAVSLWREVSHRLYEKANTLSIGQQQRVCIARTIAVGPQIILLDEPTSSLDPVSTRAIEELMVELKEKFTIVLVTHNLSQAKRVADRIIFICDGKLIEAGEKSQLFCAPKSEQTKRYLNDEFCEC